MVAAILALHCSQNADAASLTISPLRIDFDKRTHSGIVTVANAAAQPVDVVVGAYRWAQTSDAQQELSDAPELAVYPRSFTLDPGENRPIRVALLQSSGVAEGAYRLLVTEVLSATPRAENANALRVQEQLSIPVFTAAQTPIIALHLVGGSVGRRGAAITIRNDGSEHAMVSRTDVELLDAHETVLARSTVNGWYVLPGAVQRYRAPVGDAACARVTMLRVNIHSQTGADVVGTITPDRSCNSDF